MKYEENLLRTVIQLHSKNIEGVRPIQIIQEFTTIAGSQLKICCHTSYINRLNCSNLSQQVNVFYFVGISFLFFTFFFEMIQNIWVALFPQGTQNYSPFRRFLCCFNCGFSVGLHCFVVIIFLTKHLKKNVLQYLGI